MYLVYVPQGQSSLPRNQVRVTRADINKEQSHLSYSDRTGCSQYDMKKKEHSPMCYPKVVHYAFLAVAA